MRIENINPKKLKFRGNVRWRADSNLSELMESMKQNGLQSPVKARAEDKSIIYGHRRVMAALKLQMNSIPVILEEGISDKQANVLNLLENIQRKDVTSIEIGQQCDMMLKRKEFKISLSELAVSLGISEHRVKVCLEAFKRLPAKYRNKVVHLDNARNRKFGELPENVVFAILNLPRRRLGKPDSKGLDLLFKAAGEQKLTISQINLVGFLLDAGMSIKKAISEINLYDIARVNFVVLRTELAAAQRKEKILRRGEFFNHIVRNAYPNLIY